MALERKTVETEPGPGGTWVNGRRLGLISRFVGLQFLIQLVSVLTGLLVVRGMDKTHYAWYTIVFGLQGSVSALSQFAVAGGIVAIGGESIGDRRAFGAVIAAARSQRLLILAMVLPILVPPYWFLLSRAGCAPGTAAALITVIVLNLGLLLEEQISAAPFALARRYHFPQVYELGTFGLRLLLVLSLSCWGVFHPVPVIAASVVSLAVGIFGFLRPAAKGFSARGSKATPDLRKRFLRYCWNGVPTMVNTMVQSQIGVIVIASFGHIEAAADLGAITKMAVLFGIPTAIVEKMFVARMAVEADRARLRTIWLQGIGFALLAAVVLVGTVALFGEDLVWILGGQYADISEDLLLYGLYLAYLLVASAAFGVLQAKGWLKHSWLVPVTILGAQLCAFPWIDAGTVRGVILLKFAGDLAGGVYSTALLVRGFGGRGRI
jgi:hypothetical protein